MQAGTTHARVPISLTSLALLLCMSLPAAVTANRKEAPQDSTSCEQTAMKLEHSCRLEARADYFTTLASCVHLSGDARTACKDAATEAIQEETSLCPPQREARLGVCALLNEDRYADPLLDPAIHFIDPNDIPAVHAPNPFVSLQAGRTLVLRGGEDFEETVIVYATEDTREIQGVSCRVVVDVVLVAETEEGSGTTDYVPAEVTDDWFAQDVDGNVYYCGEAVRNYEDEVIVNVDGSFEAGKDYAMAGTLVRAMPVPGQAHRQEFAAGEAEDVIRYVRLAAVPTKGEGGENPAFVCAPEGCLKVRELNPLEPEASEFKYYSAGVGFVLAVALEDGKPTGEREELACVGDSLEILKDASCGIANPEELLDELCESSPDTFCPEND